MNEFHEINIMTSRGDIHGAFSLIRNWSENQARKIMKKAGYSVTPHTGRTFWMWVQETLTRSPGQPGSVAAVTRFALNVRHRFAAGVSRLLMIMLHTRR